MVEPAVPFMGFLVQLEPFDYSSSKIDLQKLVYEMYHEETNQHEKPSPSINHEYTVKIDGLVNLILCVRLFTLPLVSRINNNAGMLTTDNRKPENNTGILSAEDRKPNSFVFGHLHMATTAGTEINGLLASRFEKFVVTRGIPMTPTSSTKEKKS